MNEPPSGGRRRKRPDSAVIRPARPTDLDQLVPLWTEYVSFHERIGGEVIAPQGAELRARQEMIADISDRYVYLLLAQEGEDIVGYILGRTRAVPPTGMSNRLGIVQELVVTERCRERGIATQLARALMEWFQDRKVGSVELTIHKDNKLARRFWERSGFRLTGFRYSRRA